MVVDPGLAFSGFPSFMPATSVLILLLAINEKGREMTPYLALPGFDSAARDALTGCHGPGRAHLVSTSRKLLEFYLYCDIVVLL